MAWGAVVLADEPAALLAAYAGYHLSLGAAEVHICLDRPNPEARALLEPVAGVVLHEDGEDGWAYRGIGYRPEQANWRRKYHCSRILEASKLDWMLHCDADEFVFVPPEQSLDALLDDQPERAAWVVVTVAERVTLRDRPRDDMFSGAFRLPWGKGGSAELEACYTADQRAHLACGLAGHAAGKSILRTGRGLFMGVHTALSSYESAEPAAGRCHIEGLRLLHFDGLTPLHYVLKMARYSLWHQRETSPWRHNPMRWAQIEGVLADLAATPPALTSYTAAKTIAPWQAQKLRNQGGLRWFGHEIAARAAQVVPNCPSFSEAEFDRALLRHEAELVAKIAAATGVDVSVYAA